MRKPFWGIVALLALAATLVGHVRLPQAARAMSRMSFRELQPAGDQLPAGFVLPSSDADLRISSLIAADLDADGDLDIVAAGTVTNPVGIVVWVNDGGGRLTRKSPEQSRSLAAELPSPAVDRQRTTAVASVLPDSPAVPPSSANGWMMVRETQWRAQRPADVISATFSTLRTRSPPVLS